MNKHQPKHRHPYTPRHRVPSRLGEFARRNPRLAYGSLAGLLVAAVTAGGANEIRNAQDESYPVTTDTCHILSVDDTGQTHKQTMPDGYTVTVDRVVVEPFLELTPQTEEKFREQGDKLEVRARQILPGGAEIGQVQGRYESGGSGHNEVVLEPPVLSRPGALMEFTVGGVTCRDGLVLGEDHWQFAGPIDQYESGLQRGSQSAP